MGDRKGSAKSKGEGKDVAKTDFAAILDEPAGVIGWLFFISAY